MKKFTILMLALFFIGCSDSGGGNNNSGDVDKDPTINEKSDTDSFQNSVVDESSIVDSSQEKDEEVTVDDNNTTDPCSINNGGCDPLTQCTSNQNKVTCGACPEGYSGDGETGCSKEINNGINAVNIINIITSSVLYDNDPF